MITLNAMAELVRSFKEAEKTVKTAKEELSKAESAYRTLKEETIPGAMAELGLKNLTLDSGEVLSIHPEVYASIPADFREKAFAWLEDNDFGGIIKSEVVVEYGRKELEAAKELLSQLKEQGCEGAYLNESVHPQTLKAFLREQLRKGAAVPLELFGARPVNEAKLKSSSR